MRWFTPEWTTSDVAFESDPVLDDFQRHLDYMVPLVPVGWVELVTQSDVRLRLAGALIERLSYDPSSSSISIDAVQGDLDAGYGLLELRFRSASIVGIMPHIDVANPGRSVEIRYVEFELVARGPAECEMRFLLWPPGEFGIRFGEMTWTWQPLDDRRVEAR